MVYSQFRCQVVYHEPTCHRSFWNTEGIGIYAWIILWSITYEGYDHIRGKVIILLNKIALVNKSGTFDVWHLRYIYAELLLILKCNKHKFNNGRSSLYLLSDIHHNHYNEIVVLKYRYQKDCIASMNTFQISNHIIRICCLAMCKLPWI